VQERASEGAPKGGLEAYVKALVGREHGQSSEAWGHAEEEAEQRCFVGVGSGGQAGDGGAVPSLKRVLKIGGRLVGV
jgi:hypothetical protein